MLGEDACFVITNEKSDRYVNGYINEEFLRARVTDFSKHFYLCGPDKMIAVLQETLTRLGAGSDRVVFEK